MVGLQHDLQGFAYEDAHHNRHTLDLRLDPVLECSQRLDNLGGGGGREMGRTIAAATAAQQANSNMQEILLSM